jgi:hypothetical protein
MNLHHVHANKIQLPTVTDLQSIALVTNIVWILVVIVQIASRENQPPQQPAQPPPPPPPQVRIDSKYDIRTIDVHTVLQFHYIKMGSTLTFALPNR